MESTKTKLDPIILPEELLFILPKQPRNILVALAKKPEGMLTNELRKILGHNCISHTYRSRKELINSFDLEICLKENYHGNQCLWKLQKIEKKIIEPKKEENLDEFKIGDTVWFISCAKSSPQQDLIDPTKIVISHALVGDLLSLAQAKASKCYKSYDEAIDALGYQYVKLLRCK